MWTIQWSVYAKFRKLTFCVPQSATVNAFFSPANQGGEEEEEEEEAERRLKYTAGIYVYTWNVFWAEA